MPIFHIGCEVFIRKGNQILLGKRGQAAFGTGTWGLPGGHLEPYERLVEAVCREIHEELGGTVRPAALKLVSIADDPRPDIGTHYIHVTFELVDPDFKPERMEPEYCDEWRYFSLDNLPADIFPPHIGILSNYRKQQLYQY